MKTLVFFIPLFLLLTPPLPAPGAAMVQTQQEAVSIKKSFKETRSVVRQFLAVKKAKKVQSGKRFYNIPGIVGLATVLVGVPMLWADGIGFTISLIGAGVCLIALLLGSILKWRGNIFATLGLIGFGIFLLVVAIVFSGF